jgi:hypothetical protein
MQPKFDLGKIVIKEDAAFVLAWAGQDADFFLAKHAAGDWGEDHYPGLNEKGLREGSMVWSSYRTLRGHQLMVLTFLERQETHVFCPPSSKIHCDPLVDFARYWEQQAQEWRAKHPDAGSP